MKSFKNFLNESYVGKDGKIYASKGEYEKTVKLLDKTFKTDGVQTKLDLGNTNTTNLQGSGIKVNRGPGRPVGSTTTVKTDNFQQPELNLNKTDNTTKVNTNTTNTNVIKRPNIRSYKGNLEGYRRAQAEYQEYLKKQNALKSNKVVDTNKVNVNKTNNVKDKIDDIYNKSIDKLNKKNINDLTNKNINKLNKQRIDDIYNKNIDKLKTQFSNNKKNNVIDITNKLKNKVSSTFKTGIDKPLNVSNINVNKGVQLPNFVQNRTGPLGSGSSTYKPSSSSFTDIASRKSRLTKGFQNMDTTYFDKLTKSLDKNVGGKIPNPTYKGKKSFAQFTKDASAVLKSPRVVKGVTRVAPFVNTAIAAFDAKNVYNQSRAKGYSKPKSLAKSAVVTTGRILGGAIGGTLGAKFGLVGAIPGSAAGYYYGDRFANKAFDTFGTYKGRRKFGKSFNQFRKDATTKVKNFTSNLKGN